MLNPCAVDGGHSAEQDPWHKELERGSEWDASYKKGALNLAKFMHGRVRDNPSSLKVEMNQSSEEWVKSQHG